MQAQQQPQLQSSSSKAVSSSRQNKTSQRTVSNVPHKNKTLLKNIYKILQNINLLDMTKNILQLIQSLQQEQEKDTNVFKKGKILRGVDINDVKEVIQSAEKVIECINGVNQTLNSIIGQSSKNKNKQSNLYNVKQQNVIKIQDYLTQQQIQSIKLDIYFKTPQQKIFKSYNATIGNPITDAIMQLILKTPKKPPQKYKLISPQKINKTKQKQQQKQLPLYFYNEQKDKSRKYYKFLIFGEIGAGKTTFINSFVNYIMKIQITDQWRYRVNVNVQEGKTLKFNVYYVNDVQNQFNVCFIDTPGLDSMDQQYYKQYVEQFQNNSRYKIQNIYYFLIVHKSSIIEMTQDRKIIYKKLKQLYRLQHHQIIHIFTFSDGKDPPLLQFFSEEQKENKYYCFNNSVLDYSFDRSSYLNTSLYWKFNEKNFEDLIQYVKYK